MPLLTTLTCASDKAQISMAEVGKPTQYGYAERLMRTIKEEEGPGPGINNATKYVASNTLNSHDWKKSVFLKGDVAEEVRKLKQQDGPDIQVYGSGNLIQTLLQHDLIDEFWLKICPITLGTGKRLFAEGTIPAAFQVSKSQVSPTGVIVANLERAG